jgi:cell division protein FtsL
MKDWVGGIESRNYGIRRHLDAGMLSELLRIFIALLLVAGALLFYSWVQSQIVNIGYQSQKLFNEEEALRRTEKWLILEEETLRSPERIDAIARNELGMMPLRPNQIITSQPDEAWRSGSNAMAMVDPGTAVQ